MSAQVRRIAILVTSLDSAAGRQLLLAMPNGLARDVRKAMASLTSVDPEEQRQVLAEFRSQAIAAPTGAAADSVSSKRTVSTPAPATIRSNAAGTHSATSRGEVELGQAAVSAADTGDDEYAQAGSEAERSWGQLDVAALTDLLRGERPLVIAVVLSQLQPRRAARLLEQFPRQQHRAVIAHLTSLGDVDPEAMQAIDEHLASRIADYHHRRQGQSESAGRMQELLSAATPELRGHWQEIIADSDQQLAKRLGIEVAAKPASSQSDASARPISRSAAGEFSTSRASLVDLLSNNVVTTVDTQAESLSAVRAEARRSDAGDSATDASQADDSDPVVLPFPTPSLANAAQANVGHANAAQASAGQAAHLAEPRSTGESPLEIATLDQILELPPRTIARVLAAANGEVLLLALAGATPSFMQRFTAMLEKQDARALQARLGQLGAINLQDIDEAQRRLCELASYVVGQLRFRRPAPAPARVAA